MSGDVDIDFGQHIDVMEFKVLSDNLAEVLIRITADVVPGMHDIKITEEDGDILTLYDGLQIKRETTKVSFDPQKISQGENISFSIRSMESNFVEEPPTVTFYEDFVESNDIQLFDLQVIDKHKISGNLWLSNAAQTGYKTVEIESGNETIRLPYAFEVLETPFSYEEIAVDVDMYVERYLDANSCDLFEDVKAKILFYIPLQPSCHEENYLSETQMYFDVNQFYADEEPPSCPIPKSINAGDRVWLESDQNTIVLEKTIHPNTNEIATLCWCAVP